MKYYGKNPIIIRKCLLMVHCYRLVYSLSGRSALWAMSHGLIFQQIVADGGNIGVLAAAVGHTVDSEGSPPPLLNMFCQSRRDFVISWVLPSHYLTILPTDSISMIQFWAGRKRQW